MQFFSRPLSLSENLARFAQRIDFSKLPDNDIPIKKENTDSDKISIKEEDVKDPAHFQSSLWPWDSVRNKLREALTEVCVLADVLAIAKGNKYMVSTLSYIFLTL